MDFALFLLVTAIMFIRPTDFVPGMEGLPLYQVSIVPCLFLSWHRLAPQLNGADMKERPVLVLGVGLLLTGLVSDLLHGQADVGFTEAIEFAKMLAFYMLLVGQIDTAVRLSLYLRFLVIIIAIPIALAVLNFEGYLTIPAFTIMVDGDDQRFGASGNFSDPNDVCEILNAAMIFGAYGLLERRGMGRPLWLPQLALFAHAFRLTKSRGGLLGAAAGMLMLFRNRYGAVKSLILAVVGLAAIMVVIGGRQASLDTSEGTGQTRIQLWDSAFEILKRSPVVGGGTGAMVAETGHVSHNAFIHTYAEDGLVGGTFLFAQYYWCALGLWRLGRKDVELDDPEMGRMRPYLLAALTSFAVSEMTVTHPKALVTYTMFGLATAFIRLADPEAAAVPNDRFLRRSVLGSTVFCLMLYAFTRWRVQYG